MKTKTKKKMKTKMKTKTKIKTKMNFRFWFHFVFNFCFCFCFSFLKVFGFLLTLRGLEVPQTVNCLFLGLKVPQHFHLQILHVVQRCHRSSTLSCLASKCHSIFVCDFARGLAVQQTVNSFFIILDVPYYLEIWHLG